MTDIALRVVKQDAPVQEKLSLKAPTPSAPVEYKAPEVKLSDTFKEFDLKVEKAKKVVPTDYNSVAKPSQTATMTAFQMITDPLYNTVGKFLGVDTLHEWGRNYDKVETIVRWAKKKTGSDKLETIVNFLNGASQFAPTFDMNHKKIDQIHLYAKMQLTK